MTASELTKQVTLKSYSYSANDSGGLTPVLEESISTWAKVEPLSGGSGINFGQENNYADYRITIRYRAAVTVNWNIVFDGLTLKIKQMQIDDPARKRYLTIYASTTLQQESWS